MSKTFKTGWHVLYVRSCQEKKVHELLQENGLNSFLPLIKTVRHWSDRKKVVFKPLFPSYVFVNVNSYKEFHKAISVVGAVDYVRFGNKCALVTQKEISQVKFLIGEEDFSDITINTDPLTVGEIRRINIGVLSGLECQVVRMDNVNKIMVRIESLQQNITATIPSSYLSKSLMAI